MTKPVPFAKASIKRAVAAAREAGLRVTAIRPDGTILVEDGCPIRRSSQSDDIPPADSAVWLDTEA